MYGPPGSNPAGIRRVNMRFLFFIYRWLAQPPEVPGNLKKALTVMRSMVKDTFKDASSRNFQPATIQKNNVLPQSHNDSADLGTNTNEGTKEKCLCDWETIMKTKLTTILLVVLAAATVRGRAMEANFCPPSGCPEGVATVGVQVPVTTYVDESRPVTVTRMVPVETEVEVPRGRWVNERRLAPTTRRVYVNEQYTVNETRVRTRPETRTRRVTRTIRDTETRQVNETVYDRVCDPATGRERRVARTVCRTVTVPVRRKVCVDEPYTVNVRYRETVPVTRTRRVARNVQDTREVCERRYVTEMVREKITTMQPVTETRMETRRRAVCTTQTIQSPLAAAEFALR